MVDEIKFCPLTNEQCMGAGCAWYEEVERMCAVKALNRFLMLMNSTISTKT